MPPTGRRTVPPDARAPIGYLVGVGLLLGWITVEGDLLGALTAGLFALGSLLGWSSVREYRRH